MSATIHPSRRTALAAGILLSLSALVSGCDKRSSEEKGRDFAKERIGFAEGAANVLKEKGQGLGESVGKGVGDLVKGAGTAIKDTIYPTVKVELVPELASAGVSLLRANEGKDGVNSRAVVVHLQFAKTFDARLQLEALSSEGKLGSAQTPGNVVQATGSDKAIEFSFPSDIRLSKVDHYVASALKSKAVQLGPPLDASLMSVSQVREVGTQVTVYVEFKKPFRGGLQLRALNESGKEIGRSEPTFELTQESDSAAHVEFQLDPRTPMDGVTGYSVHKAKPKPKPTPTPDPFHRSARQ